MLQKRIMIVDDDTDILQVVSLILKAQGYEVVSINTGKNLLASVIEMRPDLILLDIQLGDIDGRLLCKEIKTIQEHAKTPVVLFSANVHFAKDVKSCLCDDFIAKPFEKEFMLKTIAQYI